MSFHTLTRYSDLEPELIKGPLGRTLGLRISARLELFLSLLNTIYRVGCSPLREKTGVDQSIFGLRQNGVASKTKTNSQQEIITGHPLAGRDVSHRGKDQPKVIQGDMRQVQTEILEVTGILDTESQQCQVGQQAGLRKLPAPWL